MHRALGMAAAVAVFAVMSAASPVAVADRDDRYVSGRHDDDGHHGRGYYDEHGQKKEDGSIQLGPRPFYLVDGMDDGRLKDRLMQCKKGPFYRSDFSIGHRGAALQFPEHTKESYKAAARQGAGIVECDVTFTNDRSWCAGTRRMTCIRRPTYCRRLAANCKTFTPATFDSSGNG